MCCLCEDDSRDEGGGGDLIAVSSRLSRDLNCDLADSGYELWDSLNILSDGWRDNYHSAPVLTPFKQTRVVFLSPDMYSL